MSIVEAYKQDINEKIAVQKEDNKLEYVLEFAAFDQLEEHPLTLQDIYFSKVDASDRSEFYTEFTSLTHVFSVGTQTFVFECLMEQYSFEFFHQDKYEALYLDEQGIVFNPTNKMTNESPLFTLVETLLAEAIIPDELEDLFNTYYGDIIAELKLSNLLPLSSVQQIFPNVTHMEAHTLEITRLYIQENVYIEMFNSELIRVADLLQKNG